MSNINSSTLVLNRSWMAIQVCSVKRAINLLYQGHAKVLDDECQAYNFDDWSEVSQQMVEIDSAEFICSPTVKIRIPRVIVLMLYDRLPQRQVSFSRKNIFERDNYTCQYCGKQPPSKSRAIRWMEKNQMNLDHILPRSRGGKTTWSNIVASCFTCNSKKGNKTLKELGWKLKRRPVTPKWHPNVNIPLKLVTHKQWANFLDVAYYNVELENDNEESN